MKTVILDEAGAELTAAADGYERERAGLGDELLVRLTMRLAPWIGVIWAHLEAVAS